MSEPAPEPSTPATAPPPSPRGCLLTLLTAVAIIVGVVVMTRKTRDRPRPITTTADQQPVETLLRDLSSRDARVRYDAVEGLGKHRRAEPRIVLALVARFDDPNPSVRQAAVEALVQIGAAGVPVLFDVLHSVDRSRQTWPAALVGMSCPSRLGVAPFAAPPEISIRHDHLVLGIGLVLRPLGPEVTAVIEKATSAPNPLVRAVGAVALGQRSCKDGDVTTSAMSADHVSTLICLLQDNDRTVQWAAAAGLSLGGKTAVPELVKALADLRSDVRAHAAQALFLMGSHWDEGLQNLVRGHFGPEAQERKRLWAGAWNDLLKPAAPALVKALADPDEDVRGTAALALGVLAPRARREAAPALRTALKDRSKLVRLRAAVALRHLGKENDQAALDVLRVLENDPDPSLQFQARAAFLRPFPVYLLDDELNR